MSEMFSRMIGTLAIILLIAAFIGGSDVVSRFIKTEKKWKLSVVAGLIGGAFGVYGNISGFGFNGAVISVRDIGPMFAGFTGGPIGGLTAGLIAGLHRLSMGGITAPACVVATGTIGLVCGIIELKAYQYIKKPLFALLVSVIMEAFHLGVVLIMVKPFETALNIVTHIAIPFIAVNSLGFVLMITIMTYTKNQRLIYNERNRMQSELQVANVIQHSLLPLLNDEYPGCDDIEIGASMDAAKEVGGDFYDVFFVDSNHLAFVIGDVSGKGVPAALFMASSKITLQNCIRDIPELPKAVAAANNALCARNEAEMFLTLWVGVLDIKDGSLKFISAGHNPPVYFSGSHAEFLKSKTGFVLGGMEDMKYTESNIQLSEGDLVYIYTDGVTEAEDNDHNLFGDDRLLGCFENKNDSSPEEIIKDVKVSIENFIKGNSQFDDMTMLCFKWK